MVSKLERGTRWSQGHELELSTHVRTYRPGWGTRVFSKCNGKPLRGLTQGCDMVWFTFTTIFCCSEGVAGRMAWVEAGGWSGVLPRVQGREHRLGLRWWLRWLNGTVVKAGGQDLWWTECQHKKNERLNYEPKDETEGFNLRNRVGWYHLLWPAGAEERRGESAEMTLPLTVSLCIRRVHANFMA